MADAERVATARRVFAKAVAEYVPAWDACVAAREQYLDALRRLQQAGGSRDEAQFDACFAARDQLAAAYRELEVRQAHLDGAEAELRRATGRPAIAAGGELRTGPLDRSFIR